MCVCVSVCVCGVRCGPVNLTRPETVKATDFKFDVYVPISQGQSGHDPLKFFRKGGVVT